MIARRKQAKFNRALPVLAAMLKYAEALGYLRKGSNPCRGTPRFKRKAMERFLSPPEYRRLGLALDQAEETHPAQVAAIRLLLYTGARSQEIGGLQWDWVQAPRLLLPDSKTGPKTIWLCSQAVQILESLPRREGCPSCFPTRRAMHRSSWTFGGPNSAAAALPDLRIHDLRHSYASIAIRHNMPLATIGKLLGMNCPRRRPNTPTWPTRRLPMPPRAYRAAWPAR
jgi:integrase